MSTESLLNTMLEHDRFHDQDAMVAGIAQRAVNNGYENLTPRQKAVLVPFLTQRCDGVTDPGGYHNDCQHILEGDDLESAIQNDMYYGGLLCPSCVDEKEEHRRQWDNIQRQ